MNYKGVKKHKRKDNIKGRWSLGKLNAEIKEKRKPVEIDEVVNQRSLKCRSKRRGFACKKGKGEHIFEVVPSEKKKTLAKCIDVVEYRCKTCGKMELRFGHFNMFKNEQGYYEEKKPDVCVKCGKRVIPDLEVKDKKGLWDGHTYKFDCECCDKNLRVLIG